MNENKRRRRGDLAPDPRMWEALEYGQKLTRILTDFYTRVYADPRLSSFFRVTMEHAIAKQYSFLAEVFTGERLYFGERPRNAHHWMVISDDLFDYREALMESCLRRHGLPDELVVKWLALEGIFRKQIVKNAPIPKKIRGIALPLEGYEELTLTVGALCDGCGEAVETGSVVRYHVRTGLAYCTHCAHQRSSEA